MRLAETVHLLRVARPRHLAAETGTPLWFQLYLWGDRGEAVAASRALALLLGFVLAWDWIRKFIADTYPTGSVG